MSCSSLNSMIVVWRFNIGSIRLLNCSLELPSSSPVVKARKAPLALDNSSVDSSSHFSFRKPDMVLEENRSQKKMKRFSVIDNIKIFFSIKNKK